MTYNSNGGIILAIMENEVQQNETGEVAAQQPTKKRSKLKRGFSIAGVVLLVVILVVLILNAVLSMFMDNYYTTFGDYRLFSIVSDSMEPTIPKGSMIVGKKPTDVKAIKASSSQDAKDGTIITFKAKNANGETILLTHRVVAISTENGKTVFTTRGDNAAGVDGVKPTWDDVVGIYTGKKAGFFGALFGFFASSIGASVLIFALFIVVVAWIIIRYINNTEQRKALETAALKKSNEALGNVSLRYDNVHEITAVMDVLGMVTEEPKTHAENKELVERLNAFIRASSLELPQTPETAAMLDSLPAPDTPGSLAAALAAGATLRQAEDGQTLVLTTMSGGKNILLTPVNTRDGIILCQQGVRINSDIAPNIEAIGITSMPAVPEFFEGQPLEKNVEYPELPQPNVKLGPQELLTGSGAQAQGQQALPSSAPETPKQLGQAATTKPDEDGEQKHRAYLRYREMMLEKELRRVARLRTLLSETSPLTAEEQLKVAEYKSMNPPKKRERKPLTDEQKAKRKAAAERRKQELEAFLNSLTPEDRELYLNEQKLARARESSIRQLQRIEADRKILNRLS